MKRTCDIEKAVQITGGKNLPSWQSISAQAAREEPIANLGAERRPPILKHSENGKKALTFGGHAEGESF